MFPIPALLCYKQLNTKNSKKMYTVTNFQQYVATTVLYNSQIPFAQIAKVGQHNKVTAVADSF